MTKRILRDKTLKIFLCAALNFLALLAFIAFAALVWYGLETQCNGVAIYQFCNQQ